MARVNLVNQQIFDNSVVNTNGTFILYTSQSIDIPNSDKGIECVVTYKDPTPDPEGGGVNFKFSAELQTEDSEGNWHTFHSQFIPFVKPEIQHGSSTHTLKYDPSVFTLDPGVSYTLAGADGTSVNTFSAAQGVAPDDFRVVLKVNENGYGGLKPFQSINITVSYLTYPV